MDINQFITELEKHDWSFEYSDDHGVWEMGRANWQKLQDLSKLSVAHEAALNLFDQYLGWPGAEAIRQLKAENLAA